MGKASTNKKVARAASTGGGRTARGARPYGWYSAIALVTALGLFLIVFSRNENQQASNPKKGPHPRANIDHWHAALGVYLCDAFAPNVKDSGTDPHGIHTHGDGIIHIHPFDKTAAGNKAIVKVFATTVGMKLSATEIRLPGDSKTYTDGKTKCGSKTGQLTWYVNGKEKTGNPADYKPADRDKIVIAFAPKGTEIPKTPPSASELDHLSDVAPTTPTTATTVAGGDTSSTTAPGATTTSAPAGGSTSTTTATTAPSTTTSAP